MKRLLFNLFFLIPLVSLFAQAPPKFNYQAVARDGSGVFIANKTVGVKVEILNGSNAVVYTETQTATTNTYGLFTLQIGGGPGFSAISWNLGAFNIRISIDPNGGTSYSQIGNTQLLSVPYALYANQSGSGTGTDAQTLTLSGKNISISNGNSVTLPSELPESAASGQVLKYKGGQWIASTDSTGIGSNYSAGKGLQLNGIVQVGTLASCKTEQLATQSPQQVRY